MFKLLGAMFGDGVAATRPYTYELSGRILDYKNQRTEEQLRVHCGPSTIAARDTAIGHVEAAANRWSAWLR